MMIQSTLSHHRHDFSDHLQRRRAHHVAEQFEEICVLRIATDDKRPLSENVEDRLAAFDIGRDAGGDKEQLPCFGRIRIPEHRRSYVALSEPRMLARQQRGSRGANRAHRQMDRARHQARGQTVEIVVPVTEHDFAHGGVVRQHADNYITIEQVTDISCGPETDGLKLADSIRTTDIGDYRAPGSH
jgi:hypothetical protein